MKTHESPRLFVSVFLLVTVTLFVQAAIAPSVGAQSARYYRIGFHDAFFGSDPDEEFIVKTSDPAVIAVAEAQLMLPDYLRFTHVNGYRIYDGSSGNYNFDGNEPSNDWIWHFDPENWMLAEASTEICDGRPTTYDGSSHFCPWNSFVKSPIIVAAEFESVYGSRTDTEELLVDFTTAVEVDATLFTVEVSFGNSGWIPVAREPAVGNPGANYYFSVSHTDAPMWEYMRIEARDSYDHYVYSDVVETSPIGPVDSTPGAGGFVLRPNRPNPFNPRTTISFVVPEGGRQLTLDVFDAAGRRVRRLADGFLQGGEQVRHWDGKDGHGRSLASGTYYYRLAADDFHKTRGMVLVR